MDMLDMSRRCVLVMLLAGFDNFWPIKALPGQLLQVTRRCWIFKIPIQC